MTRIRLVLIVVVAVCLAGGAARTQEPAAPQKPTLYLVSNSHLDTQWNWTVQDTIRELVPPTFFDNFKLFERFPSYTFNYEGAIHYMWFKEYYPAAWPTLQKYVANGRWRLAGSWVNAADTHVPSPESLMRQALYGKRFYRQEFGKVSQDIYLPDCFGFGFALPSIAAHSGLTAFSTQKLSWGAARPAPFAVGRWTGVDGSSLVASLRAGDYTTRLRSDVSADPKWTGDLVDLGGRKVGFRYFGVGDIGGAPDEESVQWMEKAVANKSGTVQVRSVSADQLARDLTGAERAALPEYTGELLLKTHGVGCYTSQAAMKTWNRRNELLADAAERAAVAAEWLGGPAYPRDRLRAAWIRFLWHQFHDDLTGTSIPQAYRFSWNDELLSLNQFASILHGSVASVGSGMDTRPLQAGIPLVVYNPLATTRRDWVEATVTFRGQAPSALRVVDTTTGLEVPAQVLSTSGSAAKLLFIPEMPGVGFKVFEVRPGAGAGAGRNLKVSANSLENERYAVTIDGNGDVSSIVDKEAGSELLQAPVRLAMFDNYSPSWPAWEILWQSVSVPPREHVDGAVVRVIERGPARVAVEIRRIARGSTFVAARAARRGRRPRRVRARHRLAHAGNAPQGIVPVQGGELDGDLRSGPRDRGPAELDREHLRGTRPAVGRHHRREWPLRCGDPQRRQVRLGQAVRSRAAPDADPHPDAEEQLRLPEQQRHREAPLHLRHRRARGRLAPGPHPGPRGAPQPARGGLPGRFACRAAGAQPLAAGGERQRRAGGGSRHEEGRGLRRHRRARAGTLRAARGASRDRTAGRHHRRAGNQRGRGADRARHRFRRAPRHQPPGLPAEDLRAHAGYVRLAGAGREQRDGRPAV